MRKYKLKKRSAPLTVLRIFGKSLLLLPILAAMVYINYTMDVSGVFHSAQYETDIALALLGGQDVSGYDQMDERGVLEQVANNTKTPFDTLSFGSSRILQLREENADGGDFFNAGVSGADFVDITGLFYRFEEAEMLPDTVILSLDHWWLSENNYDAQERSDKNLYNEFLNQSLGLAVEYDPEIRDYSHYEVLFSPSYLQGNLTAYINGNESYTPPSVVSQDLEHQENNVKLHDGSVLYGESYRNQTESEVEQDARNGAVDFIFLDDFEHLDEERCAMFDDYVQYLLSKDIQVIFVLPPYHPTVYNHALENPDLFAGFFETEPFYTAYALEHNIPMYGSYNPFVTDSRTDDFYDGYHMKEDSWPEIFPGVESALEEMSEGEAYSPWILGRVRVTEEVAARLVRERYEIGSEHRLQNETDTRIEGTKAYVFSRHGELPENPGTELELARYAVTQDEGMIYRFDTDINAWVVDYRNLLGVENTD